MVDRRNDVRVLTTLPEICAPNESHTLPTILSNIGWDSVIPAPKITVRMKRTIDPIREGQKFLMGFMPIESL